MPDDVIATIGLSKRFGDVVAVDAIDLVVRRAEIYGFLGLNGAGKSTTIRMLLGMIRPTAGRASLFGVPIAAGETAVWARVGHLVEGATAYPELTVRENLDAWRRLYGLRDAQGVDDAIAQLGLPAYADRRARTLSTGNLQRLALARALLHRPELLILDEPTNGLDPAGVVEIRELLRDLALRHGVTILMSSHVLGEVSRLATRVGIIHRGRLIQDLQAHEFERQRRRWLTLHVGDGERVADVLRDAGCAECEITRNESNHVIRVKNAHVIDRPDELARQLIIAGIPLLRLAVEEEDLEDYFMRLTQAAEATRQ